MPFRLLYLLSLCVAAAYFARAKVLPQGWRITPIGIQIHLPGDFPSRIVPTTDGTRVLVLTSGFHNQGVTVVSARYGAVLSTANLGKTYGDMALDQASGQLFVAAGAALTGDTLAKKLLLKGERLSSKHFDAAVLRGVPGPRSLTIEQPIVIPGIPAKEQYISGVAIGRDGSLFVVNINNDTVYKLSPRTYTVTAKAPSGYGAYRAVLSPDGNVLAVSNWGDESVSLFAARNLKLLARVRVGNHPNDLVFGPDGRLFVVNSGSNSVSVIDGMRVAEAIKTSIHASDPVGSTPDALAIDPAGKRLYVANADNNDIAVIDIARKGRSEVEGFIPTGWYPSALAVSRDGRKLYAGIAKGLGSRANVPPRGAHPRNVLDPRNPYDFVGDTLSGYLSVIDVPNQQELRRLTQQVIRNFPTPQASGEEAAHAEQVRKSVFPHIRHVLYIIRENRTYDEVLGDLGKGNGDPALTLFGRDVTPNAHKIANTWALFDNLFVNGEVSENGHQWSDAAYATDFTSQAWLQSYSGRTEPKASESELGADERLRSSPAGYLWDNCARHGLSFRTYGEFAYFHSGPDEGPRFVAKGLDGHASLEWLKVASSGWTDITKGRDPDLARIFIREMHEAERNGNWPRFMVMSLGEDHTRALRPGAHTPAAMVASNDQALGEIIEAVSHSNFWPETAIFVIEDDAQDGPDHVDCRRTVGFVISPYTKRNIVDSTLYATASMIHTMELILGLPPMTQFDRGATPMYKAFSLKPDYTPYENLPPQTDLFAKNPAKGPGAEASLKLDLSGYDRADPDEMNRILWAALKPGVPMPAPVRNASFLRR
ncbi:MAG: beta-propeller fold lactonase family protein [Bryobacteraceae bacterium]